MEDRVGGPYFDPDFDTEKTNTGVCIDNETCDDCTVVKVDSANRHGILLEMVQLLSDLDLVISKSYISSDGGWLMDVFHVTDQLGNKLVDPALIRFIKQSLVSDLNCAGRSRREGVTTCLGKLVGPGYMASEYAAVEITAMDRPGLLSEIAAVITELHCHVACAQAWTHNSHSATVLYITDEDTREHITDTGRLAHVEQQVDSVVEAHNGPGERWRVKVSGPMPGRVHCERRLHQLMREDRDYEAGPPPPPADFNLEPTLGTVFSPTYSRLPCSAAIKTRASVDSWKKREYSVVNIHCKDRPKLLFDTVCTLTDMQYAVFHASVGAHGPLAVQEYYIRHMDGCTLDSDSERQKVSQCLVAAVERRASHGLKVEISTGDRAGLLWDVTRVLRENSFSLKRAECATRGAKAVGTFYVVDASGGGEVDPKRMKAVMKELGEGVTVEVGADDDGVDRCPAPSRKRTASPTAAAAAMPSSPSSPMGSRDRSKSPMSLGSKLWSRLGRLSGNFGPIRS